MSLSSFNPYMAAILFICSDLSLVKLDYGRWNQVFLGAEKGTDCYSSIFIGGWVNLNPKSLSKQQASLRVQLVIMPGPAR